MNLKLMSVLFVSLFCFESRSASKADMEKCKKEVECDYFILKFEARNKVENEKIKKVLINYRNTIIIDLYHSDGCTNLSNYFAKNCCIVECLTNDFKIPINFNEFASIKCAEIKLKFMMPHGYREIKQDIVFKVKAGKKYIIRLKQIDQDDFTNKAELVTDGQFDRSELQVLEITYDPNESIFCVEEIDIKEEEDKRNQENRNMLTQDLSSFLPLIPLDIIKLISDYHSFA